MNIPRLLPIATIMLAFALPQARAQSTIDLGSAAGFAVLAGTGITFTSPGNFITGDIGSYSVPTISGIGNVTFLSGSNHAGDAFTQAAKTDLAAAYADAVGRTPVAIASALGGITLTPGVYSAGTFAITGNLTLNGSGVYIFQAGSTLDTAASSQVLLTGGATADKIFWQVGSSATFVTSSVFVGTVLANTSITAGTGANFDGRLLAMTGAVTLAGGDTVATPIPEPSTYALLAGFVALGLAVARRRFASVVLP